MSDFQINQNVFIGLPPELYGIPLENGGMITKGIVITKNMQKNTSLRLNYKKNLL